MFLIVLLVVGAVAIFWSMIRPVLVDGGEDVDITQFTLNLKIIDDSVKIYTGQEIGKLQVITIQRKPGSGNLAGIKLLLIGEDGLSMLVPDIGVYELFELESIELNLANGVADEGVDYYSTIGELTEIRVAPVWKLDDGEERIGNPTDEYFVTGYESSLGCVGGSPNGYLEEDEECDTQDFGVLTCLNEYPTYGGGELDCTNSCTIDYSGCDRCGDENVNGPELCELGEINICLNEDEYLGNQSCLDTCLEWSDCVSELFCGDGTTDGNNDGVLDDNELCESGDSQDCFAEFGGYLGNQDCLDNNSCVWGSCNPTQECGDGFECYIEGTCANGGNCVSSANGKKYCVNGFENCDDGTNDGSYGTCKSGCQSLAPYCGNGISYSCDGMDLHCPEEDDICIQAANDEWYCVDDMASGPLVNYETCDDGTNDGSYGTCKYGCQSLAPYCGDGVLNGPEECDGEDDSQCEFQEVCRQTDCTCSWG